MSWFDPKVRVHHLSFRRGVSPEKHPQWYFHPELAPKIKKYVNKLIEVGFIRELKYPTWFVNVISVRRNSGRLHICVYVQDLNNSCPKITSYCQSLSSRMI